MYLKKNIILCEIFLKFLCVFFFLELGDIMMKVCCNGLLVG